MKTFLTLLSLSLLTLAMATAQEPLPKTITAGGKTYTNVKITGVTPVGLRVVHDGGAGVIPFEELPDDMKQTYRYDPKAAALHADAVKYEQAAAMARIEAEKTALREQERASALKAEEKERRVFVQLNVIQAGRAGSLCKWTRVTVAKDTRVFSLGHYLKGGAAHLAPVKTGEQMIFVTGLPMVVDGSMITGYILPVGIHEYTAARSGARYTVYKCEFTPAQ